MFTLENETNNITIHSHFIYNATTISLDIGYISDCILYYLLFIIYLYFIGYFDILFHFILISTLIFYFYLHLHLYRLFTFMLYFYFYFARSIGTKTIPPWGLIKYSESTNLNLPKSEASERDPPVSVSGLKLYASGWQMFIKAD